MIRLRLFEQDGSPFLGGPEGKPVEMQSFVKPDYIDLKVERLEDGGKEQLHFVPLYDEGHEVGYVRASEKPPPPPRSTIYWVQG